MVTRSDGVLVAGARKVRLHGIPEGAVMRYLALPPSSDPVLRRVLETRRPTHEQAVLCEAEWHALELYRTVARPYDIEHYMLTPLIARDRIIGVVAACRRPGACAFGDDDLAAMEGVSALVAMAVAWMCDRDRELGHLLQQLAPRQQQIATFVAKGLSNHDIAAMLGVSVNTVKKQLKTMFRKLGVSRRAELAWIATAGGVV